MFMDNYEKMNENETEDNSMEFNNLGWFEKLTKKMHESKIGTIQRELSRKRITNLAGRYVQREMASVIPQNVKDM